MSTVFILLGLRKFNRRAALFIEELNKNKYDIRVYAIPRYKWNFTLFNKDLMKNVRNKSLTFKVGEPQRRPESIFCFHWSVLPVAVILKFLFRAKLFYDEHDYYAINVLEKSHATLNKIESYIIRLFEKLFLPRVSAITCVQLKGDVLEKYLRNYNKNVIVINNYPPYFLKDILPSDDTSQSFVVIYIGGLYRVKGIDIILNAFEKVRLSGRKCELHLFGEGEISENTLDVESTNVFFHGFQNYSKMIEVIESKRCIGLALYSGTTRYNLIEGNCRKVFEYMAMGVPLVVSNAGNIGKFIEKSQCGLVVDSNLNVDELKDCVISLMDNYALWQRFSKNGKETIQANNMFWPAEFKKILDFMNN